ncbi:MAG: DUF368 domain-containing protein [Hungatella sp.]
MNYASDILKGILIGIANIIPGVSGGTIAVSMGIYHKIIYAVTHLLQETKKSFFTLLPYGIGVLIGIVGLSFAIESLFERFPLQTSLTFIGLILGGLPTILGKLKHKKISPGGYGAFFLMFILVIAMAVMGQHSGNPVDLSFQLVPILLLFLVGMIAAATMVIPGVSGSMLLMLLGYYQPILSSINHFIIAATTLDISGVFRESAILIPFGLGVIVGIFLCAKLIELLLSHHELLTYCAITGLVLSSPIVILIGIPLSGISVFAILTGLLCFALSLTFAVWLG